MIAAITITEKGKPLTSFSLKCKKESTSFKEQILNQPVMTVT